MRFVKSAIANIVISILVLTGLCGVVFLVIYNYRAELDSKIRPIINRFYPCTQPITYSIGTFDKRFGLSQQDFLNAIATAESIWEKPINRSLFIYNSSTSTASDLTFNLMYDYRQAATQQLDKLGDSIDGDKRIYTALKTALTTQQAEYKNKKAAYDSLVAAYRTEQAAYNAEVESWNKKGGAPKNTYADLQQKRADLDQKLVVINAALAELNALIQKINASVATVNQLASHLNSNVNTYNTIGSSTGKEFNEGEYVSDMSGQSIYVYQFSDKQKLIRVLAHELGHALGLDHIDNPKAIMYRLNEGTAGTLTSDDLAALKAICKIK